MIQVTTLPLGAYQTNCYIVYGENAKTCAIIDPGYEPDVVLDKVRALGLTVDAVLLTHGHFDHVGGVEAIVKATDCKLFMGDFKKPKTPENDFYYPIHDCDFAKAYDCEDGKDISAGGLSFTVYATPGHTPGSVCFAAEDALFSGDTLFAGSCGRTDLPGGDFSTIKRSLQRLAKLEKDYTVYPGHGPATTLTEEKKYNPYMR